MSDPDWLGPLGGDDQLRAAGFALLEPDVVVERSDALRSYYEEGYHLGTLWLESIWAQCRERVEHCRVVARGPTRVDEMNVELEPVFVLLRGPEKDDQLWLAWNAEVPASLWIPCGRTPATILAALAEFSAARRPLRHEFECRTRLFMGYHGQVAVPNPYSGEFVAADPHDLTRHFNFSPVVGPRYWGSCRADDPWPDPREGALANVDSIIIQREVTKQAEGGLCSFTRRTKYSGSYLGIELHRGRLWVWNLMYPRSHHAEVIAALEQHGVSLPHELPFDVAGAMLGFDHQSEAQLRRGLAEAEAEADNVPAYLDALAALLCMDPQAASALLRPYLTHPDIEVRGAVGNIAAYYGWLSLLEELRTSESEPDFCAWIDRVLPSGIMEEFNDMGEPMLGGHDEEDDDDDADDEEQSS
jgi:hypothetical protein